MCKCNGCFLAQPQIEWYTCVNLAGRATGAAPGLRNPTAENAIVKDAGKFAQARRAVRFAALAILLLPAPLAAASSGEVWLVSTRCAPVCGDLEAGRAAIQLWRWDAGNCWLPATAAEFLDNGAAVAPTTIFIHGHRTDADLAVEHGWLLYGHMQEAAQGKPFRLVIWSWPADRGGRRPRADAQEKAEVSDVQAYYLARLLGDMARMSPSAWLAIVLAPGRRPGRWSCWPAARSPAKPCRQPSPRGGLTALSSWRPPPTPTPSCPAIATATPCRWSNA